MTQGDFVSVEWDYEDRIYLESETHPHSDNDAIWVPKEVFAKYNSVWQLLGVVHVELQDSGTKELE